MVYEENTNFCRSAVMPFITNAKHQLQQPNIIMACNITISKKLYNKSDNIQYTVFTGIYMFHIEHAL